MHQHADVDELLLQLEHVVEDEMRDHKQSLPTNVVVLIMQKIEKVSRMLVE